MSDNITWNIKQLQHFLTYMSDNIISNTKHRPVCQTTSFGTQFRSICQTPRLDHKT